MTALHSPRSWPKTLAGLLLLLSAIMFDGGGGIMGFIFGGPGLHSGIQAANSDHTSMRLLKKVVPGADDFSDKEGEVPVYKAYRTDPSSGEQSLIGYAFVTPDVPPEPNGFSAPIDTLVGIDLEGKIVGLEVIYYKESLRYTIGDFFSWPGYQEQFVGMSASDRFRVGEDVDGISRATISVKAMSRGVRQSIRAVTQAYIQ